MLILMPLPILAPIQLVKTKNKNKDKKTKENILSLSIKSLILLHNLGSINLLLDIISKEVNMMLIRF